MTINLPEDLERFLRAEVQLGHFASEDEAIAAAVRLLRCQGSQQAGPTPATEPANIASTRDPLLGIMRDKADEVEEILAEAMRNREQQPWRLSSRE
ncbi:MAG: hypothetical protein JO112_12215 [Planctomycetes bacterium]|nr:hypothetical protein [Planctomycetota bacterium]